MRLESFDSAGTPVVATPSPDWLEGYAAGRAEGEAAARTDAQALRDSAAQALADLTLSARDAQSLILARLAPLFDAIATRVIPDLLRQTLGHHLTAALQTAAATDAGADLVLFVPPQDVPAVDATIAAIAGGGLSVRPDPRLPAGQIILSTTAEQTSLDPRDLSRSIAAALAALSESTPRRTQNG